MFTLKSLQEAHDTLVYGVIRVIHQYENSFKENFTGHNGWHHEHYKIERCHLSSSFRLTLKHLDGREKDIYIPSEDVYKWVLEIQSTI